MSRAFPQAEMQPIYGVCHYLFGVLHAQKGEQERVAAGLVHHAFLGVDQEEGRRRRWRLR